MCIASDVFDDIASMIGDSGVCPTSEAGKMKMIKVINLTTQMLIKRLDSKGTLWYYELPVVGGCFPYPSDVLEHRLAWLDGKSLEQRDEWWEGKLSVGIQDKDCAWNCNHIVRCGNQDIIDMGDGWATPTPWPNHAHTKLALVAEHEGDAGKEVQVHIIDEYNNSQEEFLTLAGDLKPVLSAAHVKAITFLRKPVTKGAVKAYVYYDVNQLRTSFARYGPRITTASFRRKKIVHSRCQSGCGNLLIKAKRRFMPILYETDPLQICDRQALRWGVQAIAAQERKDTAEYNGMLALAVNELEKERQNEQSPGASGQIQFKMPTGGAFRVRAWH